MAELLIINRATPRPPQGKTRFSHLYGINRVMWRRTLIGTTPSLKMHSVLEINLLQNAWVADVASFHGGSLSNRPR